MWVLSFGSFLLALVRLLGSRPNVMLLPSVELNWLAPAGKALDGSRPSAFDSVYDVSIDQRLLCVFRTVIVMPLYRRKYPSGFVSRKRRSAVEFTKARTGNPRPLGSVVVRD